MFVYPEPVGVDDEKTIYTCYSVDYDLQANVDDLGNGVPALFTWTADYDASKVEIAPSAQPARVIGDVITNLTDDEQKVLYTITPRGAGPDGQLGTDDDCIGMTFTLMVTVLPRPEVTGCIACPGQLNVSLRENCETKVNLLNIFTEEYPSANSIVPTVIS
ncbi:MAG: PKD-like domain-containing protein [Saprospiraceae bacterium]